MEKKNIVYTSELIYEGWYLYGRRKEKEKGKDKSSKEEILYFLYLRDKNYFLKKGG